MQKEDPLSYGQIVPQERGPFSTGVVFGLKKRPFRDVFTREIYVVLPLFFIRQATRIHTSGVPKCGISRKGIFICMH